PPEHGLGFMTDGEHRVIGLVDGHDRGLVEHDAFAADIDERVRRAQVDGEVVGEHSGQQVVEHHRSIRLTIERPRRAFYSSTVRATPKRKLYFFKALDTVIWLPRPELALR